MKCPKCNNFIHIEKIDDLKECCKDELQADFNRSRTGWNGSGEHPIRVWDMQRSNYNA